MTNLIDVVFVSSVKLGKTCIHAYNLETGSIVKTFRGISAAPKTLCPVGTSDYILCGQKEKPFLQAWAINQNDTLQMRFPVPGHVNVMAVSQSRHKYCAVGIEEKVFVYHLNSGCQLGMISRHYQDVTCLKFTSCGNYFASGSEDGFVYIWSLFDMKDSIHKADKPQIQPHYVLGQHSNKVTALSFCGSSMRGILVSSSMDHSAKVFDLVTGHLRHTIIADSGLTACVGNAIGSQVFVGGEKGRVWGMNLVPQFYKKEKEFQGKPFVCHASTIHHLALNTAGNILITGGASGEAKIWSIVMTEARKTFGIPSFALQNTVTIGGSEITNLLVLMIDPEIFSASALDTQVALAPFSPNVDLLDAYIPHYPPTSGQEPISSQELISMAADLFSCVPQTAVKQTKKKKGSMIDKSHNSINLVLQNKKLKKNNDNLFQFCLEHVIGKD